MEISLNGLDGLSNAICFTDVPNILKVVDSSGGTKAVFEIQINGTLKDATVENGQWSMAVMGETITNVLDPSNAVNKNFYISSSPLSTSASVARALRNCQGVSANFTIEQTTNGVRLTAKAIGQIRWADIWSTNIPGTYVTTSAVDGSADSDLVGSKIDVDIYNGSNYITTLEKNYYGSEAAFNISPVLTTFAKYGEALPYTMKVSAILGNGEYRLLSEFDENYISIGYMVNQGWEYLFNDILNIAQNYSRGAYRDVDNNTILYVYEPYIPISFYNGNETQFGITVDYLDSALNKLSSTTTSWSTTSTTKKLWNKWFNLDATLFAKSFYIDISMGAKKIRYNVIKPVKATEYYQRILWRNSYGGISFFDFTGQKTETRDLTVTTYEKNIYSFYDDEKKELEKIYDNTVKYTVTLKSHLFENDGKYIFNDLLQSADVWTNINNQDYAIIIDSVSVDETDNNNIYEATVKYHYSQEPSLI